MHQIFHVFLRLPHKLTSKFQQATLRRCHFFCIQLLYSAAKKSNSAEKKTRETSLQREIVFTVYSKCKVGNANDCHENRDEAAVRARRFDMSLTGLPDTFNVTELQGGAEKFSLCRAALTQSQLN